MEWNGCDAVERRADKLSGAPVFVGTRISVATFFDNLKAGATIDEFLEWYPGAQKEQLEEVLSFVTDAPVQAA